MHVVATDKLRGDGTSAALMESSPNTPVQQVGDLRFLWKLREGLREGRVQGQQAVGRSDGSWKRREESELCRFLFCG